MKNFCSCDIENKIHIEYAPNDPLHYDGVSEVRCSKCDKRWGRWSGVELKDGEQEPPYGQKEK